MTPEQWQRGHRHQPQRRLQHDAAGLERHARAQLRPRSSTSPRSTARRARSARPTIPPPRPATSASPRRWRRKARAKGITVNAIAPGYIDTEMVQAVDRRRCCDEDHRRRSRSAASASRGDRPRRRLPRLRRRRLHHRLDPLGQRRPVLRLSRSGSGPRRCLFRLDLFPRPRRSASTWRSPPGRARRAPRGSSRRSSPRTRPSARRPPGGQRGQRRRVQPGNNRLRRAGRREEGVPGVGLVAGQRLGDGRQLGDTRAPAPWW